MFDPMYAARETAPGPKKLLALDGGGLRGLISLQVLRRIEEVHRERRKRPDLVLADE
jgi:patatin-like phospholipase/acyl hydrolase